MKVVSIVGKKNTGKTSLTTKVISELSKRGYNVASVKHTHHEMELDKENTDTWKHKKAGSNLVVGIGSTTFFNVNQEFDLNRILYVIKHLDNVDFVIIEGFKRYNYPKIITSPNVRDDYTIAEVNSFEIDEEGVSKLCDLIEEKGHDIVDTLFLNDCGYNDAEKIASGIRSGNIKTEELDEIDTYLSINDNVIGLNRFVSDYIKQSVLGIINTLHTQEYGVDKIEKVELLIKNEDEIGFAKDDCEIIINKKPLEINHFVETIVANSIRGIVKSLKTEGEAEKIKINITSIEKDLYNANITLKINDRDVEINKFVSGILKENIFGILKSLKIDDEIKDVEITIGE